MHIGVKKPRNYLMMGNRKLPGGKYNCNYLSGGYFVLPRNVRENFN